MSSVESPRLFLSVLACVAVASSACGDAAMSNSNPDVKGTVAPANSATTSEAAERVSNASTVTIGRAAQTGATAATLSRAAGMAGATGTAPSGAAGTAGATGTAPSGAAGTAGATGMAPSGAAGPAGATGMAPSGAAGPAGATGIASSGATGAGGAAGGSGPVVTPGNAGAGGSGPAGTGSAPEGGIAIPGTGATLDGGAADSQPGSQLRPVGNTGQGFFISGSKIYDANGVEFIMKGTNHTHWWGGTGEEAIPYMSNANANTVRAVFGPDTGANTPALRESIVRQYIAQRIIPVVDYHNATCDENPASLNAAVDFWLGADKAWVQSLERYVILNITNEWGPNSTVWRDGYKAAVARLRQAGVKNLIMIDAGGACGQLAESVEAFGREVFDSDPEKNIVFSIHQYGFWVDPGSPLAGTWDGRQPYDLDGEFTKLEATGLPIVVGEFSWTAFNQVTYTTRAALGAYAKHNIGWLSWMWMNPGGDATVNMAITNVYNTSADLTEFGRLLVEDPTFGMKATAQRATVF